MCSICHWKRIRIDATWGMERVVRSRAKLRDANLIFGLEFGIMETKHKLAFKNLYKNLAILSHLKSPLEGDKIYKQPYPK